MTPAYHTLSSHNLIIHSQYTLSSHPFIILSLHTLTIPALNTPYQQREMKTWVEEALIEQKQKQMAEKEEDVRYVTFMC